MYQKNDGTTRKVLRPTERVGTQVTGDSLELGPWKLLGHS